MTRKITLKHDFFSFCLYFLLPRITEVHVVERVHFIQGRIKPCRVMQVSNFQKHIFFFTLT